MSIDIFHPDYHGMFTDNGNIIISRMVSYARDTKMSWPEVYRELERLSRIDGLGEATDTDVRENVYFRLGFDQTDEPFYC